MSRNGDSERRVNHAPTALAPVLLFAFLNSIGSAVAYSGLFSLAKFQYGFGRAENFLLALLFGVAYIPAAMLVGPMLRRLPEVGAGSPFLNHRGVLLGFMVAIGVLCWVPWIAMQLGSGRDTWPIWLLCAVYSAMSGMMWPIVESYVSGGRRAGELRRAIGRFNIAWSSALVLTLLVIAPLVEERALLILRAVGVVQWLTAIVLVWFKARPGRHVHDPELPATPTVQKDVSCPHCHCSLLGAMVAGSCPECGKPVADAFSLAHPPVYARLLAAHQWLLPVAFLGISALAPYLTIAFERLKVPPVWETPLIAVWMIARVAAFGAMERWHGWHGRWTTPVVGTALVLMSLALVILVPVFVPGGGALGIGVLCAGLVGFGAGVGMVYAATLYYTMEVGSAELEASGLFETLIGVGYVMGPLCGLVGSAAVRLGGAPVATGEWLTVGMVAAISGIGVWAARRRALKAT
ncbi:MAG: MFS transporter [Phycisphaerales bacterium]